MFGTSTKSWRAWTPERLRDFIDRRRIQAEIDRINAVFRPRLNAATSEEEERLIDQEWTHNVDGYFEELGLLVTKRLEKQASRWAVDIPSNYWIEGNYWNQRYIAYGYQAKLRRAIRSAVKEEVRWWTQVVVMPLIALFSSVIALISLLWRLN